MQKTGNKIRLYFRNKRSKNFIFSSEIFDNQTGSIVLREPKHYLDDNAEFRRYNSIDSLLEDADVFTVITDDFFTEIELRMIQHIMYANGRHIYEDEKVNNIVHKIEKLLTNGAYLPIDKNKIIKK